MAVNYLLNFMFEILPSRESFQCQKSNPRFLDAMRNEDFLKLSDRKKSCIM